MFKYFPKTNYCFSNANTAVHMEAYSGPIEVERDLSVKMMKNILLHTLKDTVTVSKSQLYVQQTKGRLFKSLSYGEGPDRDEGGLLLAAPLSDRWRQRHGSLIKVQWG